MYSITASSREVKYLISEYVAEGLCDVSEVNVLAQLIRDEHNRKVGEPPPPLCPVCESHMRLDCTCPLCGYGETAISPNGGFNLAEAGGY